MREQSNVQCTTQCSVDIVTLTAKTVQKYIHCVHQL